MLGPGQPHQQDQVDRSLQRDVRLHVCARCFQHDYTLDPQKLKCNVVVQLSFSMILTKTVLGHSLLFKGTVVYYFKRCELTVIDDWVY